MDKIRCTLRQFVRDWSDEGAGERKQVCVCVCVHARVHTCLSCLSVKHGRSS
jgi:hypothetical protein